MKRHYRVMRGKKSACAPQCIAEGFGAGWACGSLWTVSKGSKEGDLVVVPDRNESYRFGEVLGASYYAVGQVLPRRRNVQALERAIDRASISEPLQGSTGSMATVSKICAHHEEFTPDSEDCVPFAMEKRLLTAELQRGRPSDVVLRHVLRDERFVKEQIAEDGQTVDGVMIALENVRRLWLAVVVIPSISLYRYGFSFKLMKA